MRKENGKTRISFLTKEETNKKVNSYCESLGFKKECFYEKAIEFFLKKINENSNAFNAESNLAQYSKNNMIQTGTLVNESLPFEVKKYCKEAGIKIYVFYDKAINAYLEEMKKKNRGLV